VVDSGRVEPIRRELGSIGIPAIVVASDELGDGQRHEILVPAPAEEFVRQRLDSLTER
jgi:hypothetical protein